MAINEGVVPPTANLDNVDPDCELSHVCGTAEKREIVHAVSNSFGFGGHNVSIILRKYES
jgi:3-oxoacyl-[acyl-carrier-protein] synthase II